MLKPLFQRIMYSGTVYTMPTTLFHYCYVFTMERGIVNDIPEAICTGGLLQL